MRSSQWQAPLIGLLVGCVGALAITLFAHENPLHVAQVLFTSAFGSRYDLGMTLFYATPLLFTGLSVAIAGQVGLFNIGAEGQLTVGCLSAALMGLAFPHLAFPWGTLLSLLAAMVAGALWAAVPALLKVWRGSHEVVTTIMMNFVAAGLASWLVVDFFQNPSSLVPETSPLSSEIYFQGRDPVAQFFIDTPMSSATIVAIAIALTLQFVLKKTVWGYRLRVSGENAEAAHIAGIATTRAQVLAMALSGAIAGLVALPEVLGSAGRFRLGFSPDYGFTGIAVALMARNSPLAVIATALLFGVLHNGTSNLDLETDHITRDFSLLIQGLILLCVAAEKPWQQILARLRPARKPV